MNKFWKILNVSILVSIITGCATVADVSGVKIPTIDHADHIIGRYYRQPKLDVKGLTDHQKQEKYANQFITQNQPYATIRGYPLFTDDTLTVVKVDDKLTQIIPQNLKMSILYYPMLMSATDLKIPTGKRNLIITGAGYENIAFYAYVEVDLKAGKQYIIKPSAEPKKRFVQIFEYEADKRFDIHDKDGIILKQAVTPIILMNYPFNF